MSYFRATDSEVRQFPDDGFIVARSLLSPEETRLLGDIARADTELAASTYGRKDATGLPVTLALRNDLSDDMYSAIARSRRVVDTMEKLLDGEVYNRITVPDEQKKWARIALDRMLSIH